MEERQDTNPSGTSRFIARSANQIQASSKKNANLLNERRDKRLDREAQEICYLTNEKRDLKEQIEKADN